MIRKITFSNKLAEAAYKQLLLCAKANKTITYETLGDKLGIPPHFGAMPRILGEITEHSFVDKDVMISALVVRGDTQLPGAGFFELADELGKKVSETFHEDEVKRVYSAYAN